MLSEKNGKNYALSVYICFDVNAVITGENYRKEIKKGDYFYLPFVAEGKFTISTETNATLIECLPSKQD